MIKKGEKWTLPHRVGHKDDILNGVTRSQFMRQIGKLGGAVRSPAQLMNIRSVGVKARAMRGRPERKPLTEEHRAWLESRRIPMPDQSPKLTKKVPRPNRHWQTHAW